jgi:hypothetical protein
LETGSGIVAVYASNGGSATAFVFARFAARGRIFALFKTPSAMEKNQDSCSARMGFLPAKTRASLPAEAFAMQCSNSLSSVLIQ